MAKPPSIPRLKHVKFTRAKGKVYAYFNTGKKVAGKIVYAAMPAFGTPQFYQSYAAFMGARTKRQVVIPTVASLAEAYQNGPEFAGLSAGTQRLYRSTLKRITEQLGELPLEIVSRSHVREVLDNRLAGNGARNIFLALVGIIYTWARGRDMTDKRPTEGLKPYRLGEHDPWPEEVLDAALTADDDRVRLATHILYYSGLRIGDAVKLRWSDIRNGKIVVTPQKSARFKKVLHIPVHSRLETELAQTPKRGVTILCHQNGKPLFDASVVRRALADFAADLGFTVVPHGLRKSAVNALLEAGCTIAEVASITGQSFNIVERYARKVDNIALGEAAIIKLERREKSA